MGGAGGGGERMGGAYNQIKKSVSKQAVSPFFLVHQAKHTTHAMTMHDCKMRDGRGTKKERPRIAKENGLSWSGDFFGERTEVLTGQACEI